MFHSKADVVERMLGAIEGGYIREAGRFLSDDFMFYGPTPEPIDKQAFLDLHQALVNAMPDWSYNISDVQEHGDVVSFKVQITGTNTGDIHIPSLGLLNVPATGKKVVLPSEPVQAKVHGEEVTELAAEKVPNGGLSGVLAQLGLRVPELASV